MPMINEAVYCLMEGVGNAEAIDTVMKLGMNHPMGPLALADLIGLDTCLAILEVMHKGLGDPKYRPCPLLRKYVAAGWLGRSPVADSTLTAVLTFRCSTPLTDEQREIVELARTFAREELAPHAAAWDREARFDRGVAAKLGELGFLGMMSRRSTTDSGSTRSPICSRWRRSPSAMRRPPC